MTTHENPGDKSPVPQAASTDQDSPWQQFIHSFVNGAEGEAFTKDAPKLPGIGADGNSMPGGKNNEQAQPHPEVAKILGNFSIASGAKGDKSATPPVVDEGPHVRGSDQSQIDPDHFNDAAKKVMKKIDTDNKGSVTREQLATALQDPSFKGEDAQALVALYRNFDALNRISPRQFFDSESLGITDMDMYQLVERDRTQERQEVASMKQWAHTNLLKFSQPGTEYLTEDGIDNALKGTSLSQNDRDMLTLVKKHFDEMGPLPYINAVTPGHFDLLNDKLWKDDTADLMAGVWSACHAVASDAQKTGTSYDLYAGKDPLAAITPEAVRQGAIGDCYFEAVVASMAKSNPAMIRDMIKDNHNGTYTVTFPGESDVHYTVKSPTEAELGFYNRGSSQGVWASVLEKAFGEWRKRQDFFDLHDTPQGPADGGGDSRDVLQLFTGKKADFAEVNDTKSEDMAEKIEDAMSKHKAIVTGIDKNSDWLSWFGIDEHHTADKFYKQHEYSITGFTSDGHGGGTVEIRNPWGGANDTPDGKISIPLNKFMRNFSDVTVEG